MPAALAPAIETSSPATPLSTAKRPYSLRSIVELKFLEGWSERKIARYFGKTHGAIQHQLKGLWRLLQKDRVETYETHRIPLMTAVEAEVMELITDILANHSRREKVGLRDAVISLGVMVDKRRLEAGESTVNIGAHVLVEQLSREARSKREPQDVVVEAKAEAPDTGN